MGKHKGKSKQCTLLHPRYKLQLRKARITIFEVKGVGVGAHLPSLLIILL